MAHPTDYAWAAGFFDGEGTVGIYARTQYHSGRRYVGWRVTATLCGVHRASIERFASIIGIGTVDRMRKPTKRNKTIWRWRISDSGVEKALRPLLPYLIVKRDQVELVSEFRASVRNFGGRGTPTELADIQAGMAARMKALKLTP